MPQAQFTHIKIPDGPPDSRFVCLSDVLSTAWQSVMHADVPDNGSVTVLGLGPIGDMAARIATHLGYDVTAVTRVPERLARAEARGSPVAKMALQVAGLLPDAIAKRVMQRRGSTSSAPSTRPSTSCAVRRAPCAVRGTISLIGVYGGMADPLPLLTLSDKQIQLRMDQANVKKWVDDMMPLLTDDDPLGVDTFATHTISLEQAPHGYEIFQKKQDGAVKVILQH